MKNLNPKEKYREKSKRVEGTYKIEFVELFEKALKSRPDQPTKSEFIRSKMLELIEQQHLISDDLSLILKTDFTSQTVDDNEISINRNKKYKETLDYLNSIPKNQLLEILNEYLIFSDRPGITYRLREVIRDFDKYNNVDNVKLLRYIKHSSTPKSQIEH